MGRLRAVRAKARRGGPEGSGLLVDVVQDGVDASYSVRGTEPAHRMQRHSTAQHTTLHDDTMQRVLGQVNGVDRVAVDAGEKAASETGAVVGVGGAGVGVGLVMAMGAL